MNSSNQELNRHSPDRLLSDFDKGRMALWVALAVAAHLVFVGATSVGYIRDKWIDPEGAASRKAAAQKPPAEKAAVASRAGTAALSNATPTAASTAATFQADAGEQIPPDRRDTPMVKRVTEKAEPANIPKQPADIGISIEDTNPK